MTNSRLSSFAAALVLVGCLTAASSAKTGRTYYTDADVAAIRARAENPAYAREVAAILKKAELLTSRSDEALWDMVPESDLPRALNVRFGVGCPVHGKEIFKAGGHLQAILKIAATVGQNLWYIGAHNAGVPMEEMLEACPRKVGGLPKGL